MDTEGNVTVQQVSDYFSGMHNPCDGFFQGYAMVIIFSLNLLIRYGEAQWQNPFLLMGTVGGENAVRFLVDNGYLKPLASGEYQFTKHFIIIQLRLS